MSAESFYPPKSVLSSWLAQLNGYSQTEGGCWRWCVLPAPPVPQRTPELWASGSSTLKGWQEPHTGSLSESLNSVPPTRQTALRSLACSLNSVNLLLFKL